MPDAPDHFSRLGLPRRFAVDPAAVERAYLAASRAVHPDFHALGTAADRRTNQDHAAGLNEAYRTVKDPARRAEYLLGLWGGPAAGAVPAPGPEFLTAMMDFRERLEAVDTDPNAAAEVAVALRGQEATWVGNVAGKFQAFEGLPDGHPARTAYLTEIRVALNAINTLRSLLREATR